MVRWEWNFLLRRESIIPEYDSAKEMKINKFKVVRQTDGTFALKDISLASLVQKLCDEIDVELTHVNRFTNRHADSLTK